MFGAMCFYFQKRAQLSQRTTVNRVLSNFFVDWYNPLIASNFHLRRCALKSFWQAVSIVTANFCQNAVNSIAFPLLWSQNRWTFAGFGLSGWLLEVHVPKETARRHPLRIDILAIQRVAGENCFSAPTLLSCAKAFCPPQGFAQPWPNSKLVRGCFPLCSSTQLSTFCGGIIEEKVIFWQINFVSYVAFLKI